MELLPFRMFNPTGHSDPGKSSALDAMRAAWAIPTRWDVASGNGLSAVMWDHDGSTPTDLTCGLDDDHLIFSLHLSGFDHASVELDGQMRVAEGLPRGSWMLVDTAGRPKAETRGRFSLLHVYIPKPLMAETCEAYELPTIAFDRAIYRTGLFHESAIAATAASMNKAATTAGPLHRLKVDCAANDLLVDLISLLQDHPSEAQSRTHLSLASRQRVEAYIAVHLSEPISLGDLARAAGLSKFHFLRAFKADYGQTPMAAVRDRRLDAAMDVLVSGNETITQIALQCGFSDHSHFSAAFRQRHGQSPSTYRRMVRGLH